MCQIMEDLRLEAEEQTLLDSIRKLMKNLHLNAEKEAQRKFIGNDWRDVEAALQTSGRMQ